MENKKLGIILLIVIAMVIIGFIAFASMHTQEGSKVKITSNKTLYENGTLKVKLMDLNKTPIANGTVNITVKDKKGKEKIKKAIKSNSKGMASLKLNLKKGKYDVNATFEGNDNYTANSTTQKLTVKEKVKVTKSKSSQQSFPVNTVTYKDGHRGVYSPTGEFFIDPTEDPSYTTF